MPKQENNTENLGTLEKQEEIQEEQIQEENNLTDTDDEDEDIQETSKKQEGNLEEILKTISQNQQYLVQEINRLKAQKEDPGPVREDSFYEEVVNASQKDGMKAIKMLEERFNQQLEQKLNERINKLQGDTYLDAIRRDYPDVLNSSTALAKKTQDQITWMISTGILPPNMSRENLARHTYAIAKKIDTDYRERKARRNSGQSDNYTHPSQSPSFKQTNTGPAPNFTGVSSRTSRSVNTPPVLPETMKNQLSKLNDVFDAKRLKKIEESVLKNI